MDEIETISQALCMFVCKQGYFCEGCNDDIYKQEWDGYESLKRAGKRIHNKDDILIVDETELASDNNYYEYLRVHPNHHDYLCNDENRHEVVPRKHSVVLYKVDTLEIAEQLAQYTAEQGGAFKIYKIVSGYRSLIRERDETQIVLV